MIRSHQTPKHVTTIRRRRENKLKSRRNKKIPRWLLIFSSFAFVLLLCSFAFVNKVNKLLVHKKSLSTADVVQNSPTLAPKKSLSTADAVQNPPALATKKSLSTADVVQNPTTLQSLPYWVTSYLEFHRQTRLKYPGAKLFTDPTAPKILLRLCLGLCGGLNDRLGQLPFDLWLANQTERILLIYWVKPWALEYFLEPNEIDWSVPDEVPGFKPKTKNNIRANFDHCKQYPLFPYGDDRVGNAAGEDDYEKSLDKALVRALEGDRKDEKVLVLKMLGHLEESLLEEKLKKVGETDMIHGTATFGNIFRTFFKPSPPVRALVIEAKKEMGIMDDESYSAVHCRVRHPRSFGYGNEKKGKDGVSNADKTGLEFSGEDKDYVVKVATHAIRCASTLSSHPDEPIYFYSDSNDLVDFMVHDLKDPSKKKEIEDNPIDRNAATALAPIRLVSRNMALMNVHIDKQKGRKVHEYYGTFVDLILGMGARCMTYGIGNYALLAIKISGTKCRLQHRHEVWGFVAEYKQGQELCTKDRYENKT